MLKRLIYFVNWHGTSYPPQYNYIFLNFITVSFHYPQCNSYSLELLFENLNLCFSKFLFPHRFRYKDNLTGPGKLKSIRLRIGKPIITVYFSRAAFEYSMSQLQKYVVPNDYYTLEKTKDGSKLFQNYFVDRKCQKIEKYHTRRLIAEFDYVPKTKEIFYHLMLNDWGRWNTDLKTDDLIEVSEEAYLSMLGAVPPRCRYGEYFEAGEPYDFINGKLAYRAFTEINGRFYTGYPHKVKEFMNASPA